MTALRRLNMERFFNPRHIAFLGGRSAEFAARQCVASGFEGHVWGVNPTRREMAGRPCYASVEDLPEGPDAVFLAVPSDRAVQAVAALRDKGAGGIASFTAGFGELGAEGRNLERDLVRSCGDMALVGPNCSGVLNYVKNAPLWPFDHGGRPTERGPAFITQSGMLGNTVTMNERALDFSYVISSGNQAMLGVEDFLDFLIDQPAVSAIGLYIEGLRDVERFAQMAVRCLRVGKPIVAQKAGSSQIGGQLTLTHTGSLAGSERLYQALFDRLGVVTVDSPVQMIEALKFVTVAGIPAGNRVAALTCSGGDSTMVADAGEREGLDFPRPAAAVSRILREQLPPIATVSNPLDYTTPLWGQEERLVELFKGYFSDSYDAALLVQDYPTRVGGRSYDPYLADARAFQAATAAVGLPAAVCSILPETMDESIAADLAQRGLAPQQGLTDAITAMAGAARFGALRRNAQSDESFERLSVQAVPPLPQESVLLDEWEAKSLLRDVGLPIPSGCLTTAGEAPDAAAELGYPVAVKLVAAELPHKTEAGAVKLGLESKAEVRQAVAQIKSAVLEHSPDLNADRFLVERMAPKPVGELLVGYRLDELFGPSLTIGAGGTLTELLADVSLLLFPVDRAAVAEALQTLKVHRLLSGYRGGPAADMEHLVDTIMGIAAFAKEPANGLVELDINPLMVCAEGPWIVDSVMRRARSA